MRQPRSIIFYAWALVAAQLALAVGVIAFVLVGGARQRAELEGLHARAQAAQLANLTMVTDLLGAQRAVRGYQATGELGLLGEYRTGQARYAASLAQLRSLTGPDAAGLVTGQARLARQAFRAADQAVAAPAGSSRAAARYATAAAITGSFFAQDGSLRARRAYTPAVGSSDKPHSDQNPAHDHSPRPGERCQRCRSRPRMTGGFSWRP